MPRTVTASFRRAIESRYSGDVDLVFITISHPNLSDNIRVVWDNADYVRDGLTYTGFPFDVECLTDDDQPPKATLSIQNVDQEIGETVRQLSNAPRFKIELLSSADFDLTVTPRQPTGTPSIQYVANKMFLTNVKVDIIDIIADIVGWDYLQRVWPGQRATQTLLRALFR